MNDYWYLPDDCVCCIVTMGVSERKRPAKSPIKELGGASTTR